MFKALLLLFALATQSLLAFGFQNPIKASDGSDPFMVVPFILDILIILVLTGGQKGLSRGLLL